MLVYKNKQSWPSGGWRYECPVKGVLIRGNHLQELESRVKQHRIQHGIQVGDVAGDILNYICHHDPAACIHSDGKYLKKDFGKEDVHNFIDSVTYTLTHGGVVSKEEAQRRTAICLQCPNNRDIEGTCSSCSGVSGKIATVAKVAQKVSSWITSNPKLRSCGVCGCALALKVWSQLPELESTKNVKKARELNAYPDHCWMK